jgi:predicted DCC family thiol-disulfide oxidoreductase YuxK
MMCTVIYDGECDFCRSCVAWVKARAEINAIANQEINPAEFGITREQCEKSVVVVADKTYFAAKAVAVLLDKSGNKALAKLLRLSGKLGEVGYKYFAEHRNGLLVAALHWVIKRTI